MCVTWWKKKTAKNNKDFTTSQSFKRGQSKRNTTLATISNNSVISPLLSENQSFFEEIEKLRRNHPSYNKSYRTIYRLKSLSLSKLPSKNFTEIIKLPTSKYKTQEDVLKDKGYHLTNKIGRGGYGVVWKTRFKNSKQDCACKIIYLKHRSNYERMLSHLRTEIYVMESFPHPNVITLLDHFIINDNAFIIMEFAEDGSLSDLIENEGPLNELNASYFFIQIVKGLIHLHKHNIAHRDLKLDNILLRRNKKVAKLTDFGLSLAAYHSREGYIKSGNFAGTRSYMAPEIIRLEVFEDLDSEESLDYDPFKVDIWALGVCLFEMLTTMLPFQNKEMDLNSMYEAQIAKQWSIPSMMNLSAQVKDLLSKLLEPNPIERIDPISICLHPWTQRSRKKKIRIKSKTGFYRNKDERRRTFRSTMSKFLHDIHRKLF